MVDCKARLTEEIQDRFNYMVDFIKIPENKKKMLENFGVIDLDDIYYDKAKNDLVYEKSKMTMYIENSGRKITSYFPNFIKKHIVNYVFSPDEDGNVLCYDCDNCSDCYKCVDCVDCIDVFNSVKTTKSYTSYFNIECDGSAYLFFSRGSVDCGQKGEWDLASCSLFLKDCRNCKNCFNLKECVECENCIDCISCEYCVRCENCIKCQDCIDCRQCEDSRDCYEQEAKRYINKWS